MNNLLKVAVLGSTGYAGLELINILTKHPNVSLNFLGSESSSGKSIKYFDKRLVDKDLPSLEKYDKIDFYKFDLVFLSLPSYISQNILIENFGKTRFIDLSADFRLDNPKVYYDNYKQKHRCPTLLKEFVYGLPEINKNIIKQSNNIAVPGCYPTSIILPLFPILKNKLIKCENIIIDSKSGYSGAGKKFDISKIKKENILNFYNYNTNQHRHICEIHQELEKISEKKIKFSFNPHIMPIFRGLMTTIYCDLNNNVDRIDIINCLRKNYLNNTFIKILKARDQADFYSVINTNNCIIKLFHHYDEKKIIIVSIIDNLIKGASGQAVQSMNIMFGLKENTGL